MKFGKWAVALTTIVLTVGLVLVFFGQRQIFSNMEKVSFKTTDNKNIAANYFPVSNPKGWLLLVHMMPAAKESWNDFAKEMQEFGYVSIAVDLRGHGESDGGPDGYQKFSDAEHQAGIKDLEAAWEFLRSRGAVAEKTAVVGASIGANLGIQFLTRHSDIGGGVFLSPGDYKGIDSGKLVQKLSPGQKALFAASKQDERSAGNNAEQNQEYYKFAAAKNKHLVIFDGAGHGTELFALKEEFDLTEAIKKFLEHGTIN